MQEKLVTFELALALHHFFGSGQSAPETVVGTKGKCLWFSRGRDALIAALEGICEPHARVLIPAFICPEVIEVVEARDLNAVLYPISKRLEPDLDFLERTIQAHDVFLYVVYFGLMRPTEAIRLSRSKGAIVFEDSSQAPFAYGDDRALWPDLAFTSVRKYIATLDGAALDILEASHAGKIRAASGRGNRRFLTRRLCALLMRGVYERRPRRIYAAMAQELLAMAERELPRGKLCSPMSGMSRRLVCRADIAAIKEARVRNYQALVNALEDHKQVEVLFPDLPPGACPYGCPIIVPNDRLWHDALANRNVKAAILWDREDHWEGFPESRWLAEHMLVLPVSSGSSLDDMQRLAAVLREYDAD